MAFEQKKIRNSDEKKTKRLETYPLWATFIQYYRGRPFTTYTIGINLYLHNEGGSVKIS